MDIATICKFDNFNPRSPHGERPVQLQTMVDGLKISIHAPRMGSDVDFQPWERSNTISIHAPRMGSDDLCLYVMFSFFYFNPRSPHGERLMHED